VREWLNTPAFAETIEDEDDDEDDSSLFRFQITVYRDGNVETRVANVIKWPCPLMHLRILDVETDAEFLTTTVSNLFTNL
jgi:hypothetical protein